MTSSFPVPHRRVPLRAGLLTLLLTILAAALLALAGSARADESLPLIDKTEPLGPGITLHHVKALDEAGWYDEQVLTVALNNPAVSANLLTSGPVASGGPLSVAANKAGAVAGVNGDFFDIGNSNAAEGAEVQSGELVKSATIGRATANSLGIDGNGLAQLVDLAVEASAEFGGATYDVSSVNAADGAGVPANGIVAYTPAWGTYSRARGFTGVGDVAEALVVDGKVVSVDATGAGEGAIPAGGFALVGRDTGADAIKALQPGDAVALAYGLSDATAKQMSFAIGAGGAIVEHGAALPGLDSSIAPRTAAGFKDGGHTLVLATWDGPGGTGHGGIGIDTEAADLVAEGVETAVNLDGGGSTTMVARALGGEGVTVRNTPSDGQERSDPNGVGVFVAPGDGQVHQLEVGPGPGDAAIDGGVRVFPGLHRTLSVGATDSNETPVPLAPGSVSWSATAGSVDGNGRVAAPASATEDIVVHTSSGGASAVTDVRVLDPIDTLELSSQRLSIAEPKAEAAVALAVTGRDDQGYTAPIEPEDLTLQYDHADFEVTAAGGGLKITPLVTSGSTLTVSVGGKSVELPITIGVETLTPYKFDDDVTTHWKNNSTAATTFSKDPEGLKIDFPAMRNVGFSAAEASGRIEIPGQPLRLRVKLKSSIAVPSGLTYISFVNGNGVSVGVYGSALVPSDEWQYATFPMPANTVYPIAVQSFQGINTSVAEQKAGTFVIGAFEADVPPPVTLPPEPAPRPDRLFSDDGKLPSGGRDWQFATLSDIQFTADNPGLTQVATTAIHRIRQTHPDLLVLNGDVTDRGLPQDLSLAREVLEEAGCDLIPVGSEPPAESTPDPSSGKIPCYYVPGNHESYGLKNVQETLANFEAEFGQPYRYFDHKGTRFILLASSLGTLRGTDWQQLPVFQKALAEAQSDPAVDNVMVFAHHPVDDPSATKASQLGDREEVALIEKMLTDFREASGKGAAMVGSHAQVAYVHRIEGVPYVVLPSSGKDPYGTPDHGGFTGWVDWSVDPEDAPNQQWLTGDVHAFAQSIDLNLPATLEVSASAPVGGSIVQPEGVSAGTRIVPLRYPMSVNWGGSPGLAIGSGKATIEAARAAGKTAILDPATESITGLRTGAVTVTETNDSMRPYTGEESLRPITASKTIRVVPFAGTGPVFSAGTPVFPLQTVGTIGEPQAVTVTDEGDQPLQIGSVAIRPGDEASRGAFVPAEDGCGGTTVAPGESCTVVVRFAPSRADATSTATLALATNTTAGEGDVALTGTSTSLPIGETGPAGPAGPRGPAGPTRSQGGRWVTRTEGRPRPPRSQGRARPRRDGPLHGHGGAVEGPRSELDQGQLQGDLRGRQGLAAGGALRPQPRQAPPRRPHLRRRHGQPPAGPPRPPVRCLHARGRDRPAPHHRVPRPRQVAAGAPV